MTFASVPPKKALGSSEALRSSFNLPGLTLPLSISRQLDPFASEYIHLVDYPSSFDSETPKKWTCKRSHIDSLEPIIKDTDLDEGEGSPHSPLDISFGNTLEIIRQREGWSTDTPSPDESMFLEACGSRPSISWVVPLWIL